MNDTSLTLLKRLRNPEDRAAWDRFVELYVPVLQRWADHFLTGRSEADDLVQEVFLVLLRELPRFQYRENGSFRGWLKTVARNVFLQQQRKQTRENQMISEATRPEVADDPVEQFWQNECTAILYHRALQILNHDFDPITVRAALAMILESRPAREIAAETHLTRAAVYAAKARVLARLRQELGDLFD